MHAGKLAIRQEKKPLSLVTSMKKINDFLDKYVLPWPVRFLSNRFVILCTIALLIPLVVYAGNQVMVMLVNSYLNIMGVAVSSIVLLYATISESRQKKIAEMQERRAQEDHIHVVEMHTLMHHSLQNQQMQIEDLKRMLSALHGLKYTPPENISQVNMRGLHPRGAQRFETNDTLKRLAHSLSRQSETAGTQHETAEK